MKIESKNKFQEIIDLDEMRNILINAGVIQSKIDRFTEHVLSNVLFDDDGEIDEELISLIKEKGLWHLINEESDRFFEEEIVVE